MLIETLPAAFEMEEILYELRDHSAGLNAGRWDYMFSAIKCFRERPEFVLPDRNSVTMTAPFMRAYTELLVKTCHRRGAHAMGGMAAFVPSRTDEQANEKAMAKLREDKGREAGDGFDGTWVAHPDMVAAATEEFDQVLGDRPNQVDRLREEVSVSAADLLDTASTPGEITLEGLRSDVNVGIQYISSWLRGNGAAGIYGLMEDAATAEISRSQVWQWIRHGVELDDGRTVTAELVREIEDEQLERIRAEIGDDEWFESEGRPDASRALFEQVALADDFVEFLTLPAYDYLLENVEPRRPRPDAQPRRGQRLPGPGSWSSVVASRTLARPSARALGGVELVLPTTAWQATPAAGSARELADRLARERLRVEPALSGDHEARLRASARRSRARRARTRRRARASRRETPTGRRRARPRSRSSARRGGRAAPFAASSARRCSRRLTIASSAPFCGPNTRGASSQGVLDVAHHLQLGSAPAPRSAPPALRRHRRWSRCLRR